MKTYWKLNSYEFFLIKEIIVYILIIKKYAVKCLFVAILIDYIFEFVFIVKLN